MSAPPLADVQGLFWKLLVAPEGVAKGIASLEAGGEPARENVEAWFAGDERLGAAGRLDVYANMYFFRIRDAVGEDYPALVRLLGDAGWHNLMTDYLLAHPSTHWSLRYAGARIPEFLDAHPVAGHPEAADLARLERAIADVFQQADVPPFPREALGQVPPEAWPDLRFTPAPAAALLDLAWDVGALRDAAMAGEELPEAPASPTAFLVWREDDVARHLALAPAEAAGLRALLAGEPFGGACERMADAVGEDEAAAGAAALLGDALARGLFAGFVAGDPI